MNPYIQLLSLLTNKSSCMFCTYDEICASMLSVIHLQNADASLILKLPTYKDRVKEDFTSLSVLASEGGISLTSEFDSPEIIQDSIAYHRIKGMIMAESSWWFSTKQFERDLLAAESNNAINAHFVHITSGGGEAWYLDQLSRTMAGLEKPVYVYIEKLAASAAYYIAVHGTVIRAMTPNDTIGSIGTMISFMDYMPYFEKMGIKEIREYATRSDLKNKKLQDLIDGKPEQFIKEELDPLQQQFETVIRKFRPQLNSLPEDDPVFRGETFSALHSVDNRLIDSITTINSAISEASEMGMLWRKRKTAMSYL